MKIAKFFLFVIMAITISSCSNEGVDTPDSESILGKWKTLKITDSKGVNMPLQACGYNQLLTFFKDGSTTLMDPCQNTIVSSNYKLDKNTLTVTTFDTSDKTTLVEKYTVLTLDITTLRIQITWDSDYGTFPENERIIIEFVKNGSNSINKNIINTTVSSITGTTAKYEFNVISDDNLTGRGVCWSTSPNPLITGSHTSNLPGSKITGSVTNLLPNTKYYLRAYTKISNTVEYGDEISFSTLGFSFSVGDSYQGGKIAYIFTSGDPGYRAGEIHGLIAATTDQSLAISWSNGENIITGATGSELGTGNSNTNLIVNKQGTGQYAARLCYDLVLDGYSDWYLPSKDELKKLYINRAAIGGFAYSSYWSSSEYAQNLASYVEFWDTNGTGASSKNGQRNVRAIRAF